MTLFAELTDSVGTWAGSNGFRLMPSDPLDEAPATADVWIAAGRGLVGITYTWTHPEDGAQDGLVVLGGDDSGVATALWGDTWHQAPGPAVCSGTVDGGVVTVGCDYGSGWLWRIVVDPTEPGTLRLRMDNVVPDDAATAAVPAGPYPAMVTELRRAAAPSTG